MLEDSVSDGADGAAALDYLRNEQKGINLNPPPDIIFLDLNIPRTRGEEVLKYVKSNNLFQHIPVVVITNSINRDEMVRVYRLWVCPAPIFLQARWLFMASMNI